MQSSSSSSNDCFKSFTKDFKDRSIKNSWDFHFESDPESQPAWPVWLIQFKAVSEAANLLAIDPSRWPTVREQLIFYRRCRCSCTCSCHRRPSVCPLTACRFIGECKFRRLPRKRFAAAAQIYFICNTLYHPLNNFNYRLLDCVIN